MAALPHLLDRVGDAPGAGPGGEGIDVRGDRSQRLAADLSRVCAQQVALFGELPCDRYMFMALATGDGYGGLEHRFSTSLICGRSDLPRPGVGGVDKGYRKFLGLCSHEYFHLWNMKRIQPARLQESDLMTETHTELLWAFEGITSYYDDLGLRRSGLVPDTRYLEALGRTITRVLRGSGRLRQSVAESSFDNSSSAAVMSAAARRISRAWSRRHSGDGPKRRWQNNDYAHVIESCSTYQRASSSVWA